MTINQKQKGNRGERNFSNFLSSHGYAARRSAQFCGQSGEAADIVCKQLKDWFIEVKHVEKLNLPRAFEKAEKEGAQTQRKPLVAHKRNHTPWLITITAEDFLSLLGDAGALDGNVGGLTSPPSTAAA